MSASTNTNLIARTALSGLVQTYLMSGLPITKLAYTTLNERLSIQNTAAVAATDRPTFGYYCIGDKGHYSVAVSDGDVIIEPAAHEAGDFAPFNMIPFVLRTETDDLSTSEMASYALRRQETYDGVNYFAYYLKRVDLTGLTPKITETKTVDGTTTTTDYTPNNSNLYPTRSTLTTSTATTTSSDYLSVTLTVDIPFTENDVSELNNVASIIYGNQKRAIISEIGLVTGIDRTVTTSGSGSAQITMNEAIYAQVITWLSTYRQMSFDNQGFTITLEMGANEPMLTTDAVTTSTVSTNLSATISSNT